jgi:predicted transcriptional regulator
VLDTIKYQKPSSIYELAKILERPFKAVNDDVKLLEKFGILKLVKEKTKKRIRLKPQILTDHIVIHLKI